MKKTRKFKAIAHMFDGNHNWTVIIYDAYETMIEAEKAARAFARKYDDLCQSVQVLDA